MSLGDEAQQLGADGREGNEEQQPRLLKAAEDATSRRIDIPASVLEDAMTTILVALHGGLGDAGLALREEVS